MLVELDGCISSLDVVVGKFVSKQIKKIRLSFDIVYSGLLSGNQFKGKNELIYLVRAKALEGSFEIHDSRFEYQN